MTAAPENVDGLGEWQLLIFLHLLLLLQVLLIDVDGVVLSDAVLHDLIINLLSNSRVNRENWTFFLFF